MNENNSWMKNPFPSCGQDITTVNTKLILCCWWPLYEDAKARSQEIHFTFPQLISEMIFKSSRGSCVTVFKLQMVDINLVCPNRYSKNIKKNFKKKLQSLQNLRHFYFVR